MAGPVLDLELAVAKAQQLAVAERRVDLGLAPQARKLRETERSAITTSSGIP